MLLLKIYLSIWLTSFIVIAVLTFPPIGVLPVKYLGLELLGWIPLVLVLIWVGL